MPSPPSLQLAPDPPPAPAAVFLNALNSMSHLKNVVFVGGDHHRTYANAVTEFEFYSVEFVCSAMTQQSATPEGAWPTHGRIVSADRTFGGNRVCTLDVDADAEAVTFTEWQMRSADRTALTPGMVHTIPFAALGRKKAEMAPFTETLVVHSHVTMDMSSFQENNLLKFGVDPGPATSYTWKLELDIQTSTPAATFYALGYVERACAAADFGDVCLHGPMVWDRNVLTTNELVSKVPLGTPIRGSNPRRADQR